ncbi:MAG: MarR family transcriptional regulator [Gammaproteobacteria bacterium]|jgi:DNA-binding MarR family transcriptional regulator|nr:MarR family transcriptional regulator [Gammaproteobacteria bacterium]
MNTVNQVLVALRRIIRATDQYSSHLARTTGMTAPQILLLQSIAALPGASVGALAAHISLSQATVTTIINRLEKRELLYRERSQRDKRVVNIRLTDRGRALLAQAPTPLQEQLARQFTQLAEPEQMQIVTALEHVARMMDAEGLDAAPVLDIGKLDRQDNPAG